MDGIDGDLPDTEEAEDVVDAVGIEIPRHLAQAGPPPGVVVPRHAFPVVGRESPVLAGGREGIGRGSGLRIHVEEARELPGVGARAADADRQVALEDDPAGVGVTHGLRELEVQVVLDVAVEGNVAAPLPAVGLHFRAVEVCVVAPA